jgi:hypothetical protein
MSLLLRRLDMGDHPCYRNPSHSLHELDVLDEFLLVTSLERPSARIRDRAPELVHWKLHKVNYKSFAILLARKTYLCPLPRTLMIQAVLSVRFQARHLSQTHAHWLELGLC